MANFVDAHNSHLRGSPQINLDRVAQLEPVQRTDDSPPAYDCLDAEGRTLGRIDRDDVPDHPPTVVPEARATTLVGFWPGSHERFPVVGWTVVNRVAEPVTFEVLPSVWCIEVRIGGATFWAFPYDRRFDTFAEAEEYAATRLKSVRQRDADAASSPLSLVGATRG